MDNLCNTQFDFINGNNLLKSKEGLKIFLKYCEENNISEQQGKKVFNITIKGSLTYYKKKFNKNRHKKVFTKQDILDIIDYSNNNDVTEKESCIKFGLQPKLMTYYKRKYGISPNKIGNAPHTYRVKRIHNVSDTFFSVPNIINSYYAGFIAADGYVRKKELRISLSSKDRTWLEHFKDDIKYEGVIYDSMCKNKFPVSTISLTSEQIVDDLHKNYNIITKKSLILTPPNLKEKRFIDAFICGYIDGDGTICKIKHNIKNIQEGLSISVIGTQLMCEWIKKRFEEICGKTSANLIKKNNVYTYQITDTKARLIFEHFYKMEIPKLERKWKDEIHNYCLTYKKRKPLCRRKGVYIYDINGHNLHFCETLEDAHALTNVDISRISNLCKLNDNKHMSNGFMFNREAKDIGAFIQSKFSNKIDLSVFNEEYYTNFLNRINEYKAKYIDKG